MELPIDRVHGYCTLLARHSNKQSLKIGDSIYTLRFCTVKIAAIFETEAKANSCGYCEPTYYKGDYIILGKTLDLYHMEFAAVPKGVAYE